MRTDYSRSTKENQHFSRCDDRPSTSAAELPYSAGNGALECCWPSFLAVRERVGRHNEEYPDHTGRRRYQSNGYGVSQNKLAPVEKFKRVFKNALVTSQMNFDFGGRA